MYGNFYGYPYMNAPINAQMNAQPLFNQNPMQAQANPVPAPSASPAFLQVGTAKEFDNVTIQPGRQALIMAQNDPYIAFKSADAMGMVTTSLYRLEPVTADQINALNLQTALCGIPRTSPYGYGIYAYPACSGYNGTCGNCAY